MGQQNFAWVDSVQASGKNVNVTGGENGEEVEKRFLGIGSI